MENKLSAIICSYFFLVVSKIKTVYGHADSQIRQDNKTVEPPLCPKSGIDKLGNCLRLYKGN